MNGLLDFYQRSVMVAEVARIRHQGLCLSLLTHILKLLIDVNYIAFIILTQSAHNNRGLIWVNLAVLEFKAEVIPEDRAPLLKSLRELRDQYWGQMLLAQVMHERLLLTRDVRNLLGIGQWILLSLRHITLVFDCRTWHHLLFLIIELKEIITFWATATLLKGIRRWQLRVARKSLRLHFITLLLLKLQVLLNDIIVRHGTQSPKVDLRVS